MNTTSLLDIVTAQNQLATLEDDYKRVVRYREYENSDSSGTIDNPKIDADNSFEDSSVLATKTTSTADTAIDDVVAPLSARQFGDQFSQNTRSLNPIAEWEGYIESIDENVFLVRMVNIRSNSQLPEDEATFQLNELSDYQRQHLEVGAIVRWVIGMERLPSDQRRKVSELHFRRLPAHSNREYKTALTQAREMIDGITWDDASG